jgi:hypothetical protein
LVLEDITAVQDLPLGVAKYATPVFSGRFVYDGAGCGVSPLDSVALPIPANVNDGSYALVPAQVPISIRTWQPTLQSAAQVRLLRLRGLHWCLLLPIVM